MELIFDTHAHYDDPAYDADRDILLAGLESNGVGMVVNVCAAMKDLDNILKLAEKYDFMYASAGVHPSEVYDLTEDDMKVLKDALKNPKTVAVGEIGLDYHYEDTDKAAQKKWFVRQIALAMEENYPILIHSREAAKDTLDIVKAENARDVGGVVHCFSYEKEMAREYLDLGFYIGIGGVLTYKNARKLVEVAEYMPMERLLLETDCPYLSPVPHRGERNDSTNIKYVVDMLSQIRKLPADEIIRITRENACRMYRISR